MIAIYTAPLVCTTGARFFSFRSDPIKVIWRDTTTTLLLGPESSETKNWAPTCAELLFCEWVPCPAIECSFSSTDCKMRVVHSNPSSCLGLLQPAEIFAFKGVCVDRKYVEVTRGVINVKNTLFDVLQGIYSRNKRVQSDVILETPRLYCVNLVGIQI